MAASDGERTFCNDPFWDSQRTWNTTDPDFTECFQSTVVMWMPCVYLILLAPFRVYYLSRNSLPSIPLTCLNITKTVASGWIALMATADIGKSLQELASGENVGTVFFVSPLIVCLTLILSILIIHYERRKGVRSSGFLIMFWFQLTVSTIIVFQSKVRVAVRQGGVQDIFRFVTFNLLFPVVLLQIVLSAFVDKQGDIQEVNRNENPCPEGDASFLSRITYWWFSGMVVQGYKRALEKKDLWTLNAEDTSNTVIPHFERYWQKQIEKAKKKNLTDINETTVDGIEIKSVVRDGQTYSEVQVTDGKKPYPAKLLNALVAAYYPMFLLTAVYKFIYDVFQFISPLLLKLLIQFTQDKSEYMWRGIFYSLIMLIIAIGQSLILHQYFHGCQLLGMRLRTSLISSIYNKMLNLSNASKKTSTVGEIVNLMSVDAQRFMDLMTYLHTIWSGPFQIILALYFLWRELGASILAGFGILLILIPINALIAKKSKDLQVKQMRMKDTRIKVMNEVLNGIKVLKLYAWEPSFEDKILKYRNKEMQLLKTMSYLNACVSFTWTTAPFLVTLVTFAVYVLSDPNNVLDAEKAFVSLSLFNLLRFPMSMLPQVISQIVQTTVSLNRLQSFLNNEELDPNVVQRDPEAKSAILMEKTSFTWDFETPTTLKEISLEIKESHLIAVVGTVGSGKSSLLSAILGEMVKLKGRVNVKGSIAYAAQQAWIQNSTLKDNILFGKPYHKKQYDDLIDACALRQDLDILPGGDLTEIGEKGINLSGGQKQRVSLARAIYSDADIYLLDDPLSAVDSHVGKHIFDHVIGPEGLLKSKTRVLVTHGISFLPKVDLIVTLVDGEISEIGTFKELMSHAGAFAEFLQNYLAEELENKENVEADLTSLEDLKITEDLVSQLDTVLDDTRCKELKSLTPIIRTEWETHKKSGKSVVRMIDYIVKLTRMKSEISELSSTENVSRYRTTSETSHTPASPPKSPPTSPKCDASPPKSPDTNSLRKRQRPVLQRQKSEFCHPADVERQTEEVIKQVEEKKKQEKLIKAETSETGTVKLAVFGMYLKSVGVLLSVIIILFYVLYNVTSVYSNVWLSDWSNDGPLVLNGTNGTITYKIDTAQRDMRLGVYGLLGVLQGLFVVVASLALYVGNVMAGKKLHALLLKNILASPMMFFDTTPLGRVLNRFSKDIDVLDTIIPRTFESWLACLLRVLSVPIVIGYSTPYFLIVFIPLAILYIAVQRFYVATSRQLKRLESVSRSPIYSHFGETITGVSTIRAYGLQPRFIGESQEKVDDNNICYFPGIVANRWLAVRLEFVGNCIVFFACLFAVLGRDSLTGGLVGLSITYALNVTQTLNWLVRMTTELETNIVAVERVKEYSETPTEAAWTVEDKKPSPEWPDKGEVKFDNYGVRYREGLDLVIKGISCNIKSGEKVGIVGRTGAGKSSLTLALFRIIEKAQGSINIDGIEISTIGLHDLRSKLTIIPQEPVLFSGSLRMNLDPFDSYTDDAVWKALELAHLKNFVSTLPDGLSFECSEGGENLSVGQRQLVCLARAVLRKTKILILDEATAAVDLETDDLIQSTIRTEFADCTIMTIAHRLNTIMDYDRIMVLSAGVIHEFESPQQLLQDDSSIFYGMAKDANLV